MQAKKARADEQQEVRDAINQDNMAGSSHDDVACDPELPQPRGEDEATVDEQSLTEQELNQKQFDEYLAATVKEVELVVDDEPAEGADEDDSDAEQDPGYEAEPQQPADLVDDMSGPDPDTPMTLTATTMPTTTKRKRGDRGSNQYPTGTFIITEVDGESGAPRKPKEHAAKFRNACGFLARDQLDPSIKSWSKVLVRTKVFLWAELQKSFKVPKGTEQRVEKWALKTIGESFRRWRSKLNLKYVQQGLTPFKEYGKITQAQWDAFVAEKTTKEAQDKSAKYSNTAKRTRMEGVPVRSRNWSLARNEKAVSSLETFNKPETTEVVKKMAKLAEDKKKGLFKPSREKNELLVSLGNKKHMGQVRGKGKMVVWKEGREEDKEKYKKAHKERYKKAHQETDADFDLKIKMLVEKILAERGFLPAPAHDDPLLSPSGQRSSSVGSTVGNTPVDSILEPTPCKLVVRLGRGSMVFEVATGIAHPPGSTFHCRNIPQDYTRVEVGTVKQEYKEYSIDIPTDEGLTMLGDCEGQFILWHKEDIQLDTPFAPRVAMYHLLDAATQDEIMSAAEPLHCLEDHALPAAPQSPGPPQETHAREEETANPELHQQQQQQEP